MLVAAHVHSEACQQTETVLTCTLPEEPGHTHSESCTGTRTVQVCALAEHVHGDGCFTEESLICMLPESEEHTHSESCSGTLIGTQAVSTTATKVNPWQIDNTGNTMYVLYAQINGRYYALSGANGGSAVSIGVSGNNITLPADNTENLFWTFVDKPDSNTDYLYNPVANVGTGRHLHPYNGGAMTTSPWDVLLEVSNDNFKVRGNGNYRLRMTDTAVSVTTTDYQATSFYVAAVGNGGRSFNVWFDGTLGGMMSYYGAAPSPSP